MAAPLSKMADATATWNWTSTHTKAFNYTKAALSTNPAVRPINYHSADQIYVVADTNFIGTGAWIGQGPTLQTIIPTDFHSRKFNINKTLGLLFGIVCIMNIRFANW